MITHLAKCFIPFGPRRDRDARIGLRAKEKVVTCTSAKWVSSAVVHRKRQQNTTPFSRRRTL